MLKNRDFALSRPATGLPDAADHTLVEVSGLIRIFTMLRISGQISRKRISEHVQSVTLACLAADPDCLRANAEWLEQHCHLGRRNRPVALPLAPRPVLPLSKRNGQLRRPHPLGAGFL